MRGLLLSFAIVSLGCAPDIGDACDTSTDCSQNGDRLCDVSQREHGGYCTVFDCEPNKCPEEADCVVFGASPSSVPECQNSSGTNPSQRSFCMKKCDSGADCRGEDGYVCLAPEGTAVNIDGPGGKVCMLPQSGADPNAANLDMDENNDRPGDVCVGVSAGGTGGSGSGGSGATSGEGGEGGTGDGGASSGG